MAASNCSTCFTSTIPDCQDELILRLGLVEDVEYTVAITDKFGHVYQYSATANAQGQLTIPYSELKENLLNPWAGVFTIEVYDPLNALVIFVIDEIEYSCIQFSVRNDDVGEAILPPLSSTIGPNPNPPGEAPNLALVLTAGNDGGAKQIKNILDPTDDQDAVTKKWAEESLVLPPPTVIDGGSAQTRIVNIQIRRAALTSWQAENPILSYGEVGLIHGNVANSKPRIVIGDGSATFNSLYNNTRFFLTYEDLNQNYLSPLNVALTALITAESNARLAGDNANASLINGLTVDVDNLSDSLDLTDAALATETDNRINGDETLQAQITSLNGQIQLMNGAVIYVGGVSGEAISKGDLLIIDAVGTLFKYDYTEPSHRNGVFGLAMNDSGASEELSVHLFGVFTSASAIFVEGSTMFGSQSVVGGLTNTQPTGANAIKIGYAINDFVINVSIEMASDDQLRDALDTEIAERVSDVNALQAQITAIASYSDLWIGAAGANLADAQTLYFGQVPVAPQATTTQRRSVYFTRGGEIVACSVGIHSTVAGSNESWSLYIRINDTTDVLIASVSNTNNLKTFTNSSLTIDVNAGDFFEMKLVCPTWATNPTSTFIGGYLTLKHS